MQCRSTGKWVVIGLLSVGLALSMGACSKETDVIFDNTGADTPMAVTKVVATKKKLPLGNTQFNITNNKIDSDQLFGPAVTEAWAKEGHVMLVFWVKLDVASDKAWIALVRSIKLIDSQGTGHRLNLWYFKDAYRVTHFIDSAQGLGLGPETRLGFQIKEPLPAGLKLMAGGKEIAALK